MDSSSVRPLSQSSDPSSRATSHLSKTPQGRRENVRGQGESCRHPTTIGMFPDDVLLEIFHFCQAALQCLEVWKWHLLVRVCRRWRQIIFGSPHRLNLQILCTLRSPARKNLGIWPPFPIVIDDQHPWSGTLPSDDDNIIAALEHPDRVHIVRLSVTNRQLRKVTATVMQEPFPVLTHLHIFSNDENTSALPAEFLGGFAPCLRSISLNGIPFPAFPTLLLSTSDLVNLDLLRIPPTGYIPPEAMVACLAALHRLETFTIGFESATSRPDRMPPPPVTRSVLPALTSFQFEGASEYLEDLVSRIDSPQLNGFFIVYLIQPIGFQIAQLSQFIYRTFGPELTQFRYADVGFSSDSVVFGICTTSESDGCSVGIVVPCEEIDWQFPHTFQFLSQYSAILSNAVHLELFSDVQEGHQFEGTDDDEWLHLLLQFPTVQTLHVSQEFTGNIPRALEGIAEEIVTEVLPSLNLVYLEGYSASSIETFIAARQRAGRPVTVIDTKEEFDQQLESYVSK